MLLATSADSRSLSSFKTKVKRKLLASDAAPPPNSLGAWPRLREIVSTSCSYLSFSKIVRASAFAVDKFVPDGSSIDTFIEEASTFGKNSPFTSPKGTRRYEKREKTTTKLTVILTHLFDARIFLIK